MRDSFGRCWSDTIPTSILEDTPNAPVLTENDFSLSTNLHFQCGFPSYCVFPAPARECQRTRFHGRSLPLPTSMSEEWKPRNHPFAPIHPKNQRMTSYRTCCHGRQNANLLKKKTWNLIPIQIHEPSASLSRLPLYTISGRSKFQGFCGFKALFLLLLSSDEWKSSSF